MNDEDEVMQEIRRIREEMLAEYDYDLDRYAEAMRDTSFDWPAGIVSPAEARARARSSNPDADK